MADPRVEVEYIEPTTTFNDEAPSAPVFGDESVSSPTFYNECEWRTYERIETGLDYHYIDDIDFGGEASDVE